MFLSRVSLDGRIWICGLPRFVQRAHKGWGTQGVVCAALVMGAAACSTGAACGTRGTARTGRRESSAAAVRTTTAARTATAASMRAAPAGHAAPAMEAAASAETRGTRLETAAAVGYRRENGCRLPVLHYLPRHQEALRLGVEVNGDRRSRELRTLVP